ncbi:MAG: hypothetical protein ACRCS9_16740 [Hyphomicrobium sp.]
MIQTIIAGIWVVAVTLGAVYFGSTWGIVTTEDAGPKANPVEYLKLKPITVPVVGGPGIEGYLLAVIGCNIDRSKLTDPATLLDPVLQDEAFRVLYGVDALKYKKPRKSDLAEISKALIDQLNKRLGAEVIKEILIEELSFIPKESARAGRGG